MKYIIQYEWPICYYCKRQKIQGFCACFVDK